MQGNTISVACGSRSVVATMVVGIILAAQLLCVSDTALHAEDSRVGDASRGEQSEQTRRLIRETVQKALPAIERGGKSWIEGKDCVSCHRVSFTTWSLNRAVERGFETDRDQLREWNSWATQWKSLVNPKRRDEKTELETLQGESDTIAQLLLGQEKRDGDSQAWVDSFFTNLVDAQQGDGSWKPAGQLPMQKRPEKETQAVTTRWTMLGLQSASHGRELPDFSKARQWLGQIKEGKSTEWWAVTLLGERADEQTRSADQARKRLLGFQNDDGGWGWLVEEESDALGTGIALYALARDGMSIENAEISRAIGYLSDTQRGDGTWGVRGTKKNARGRIVETASYWGTCWSVIAMTELLD